MEWEYALRDHLGNARLHFADRNGNGRIERAGERPHDSTYTELIQENHYYPFGLELQGPWAPPQIAPDNPYRYNGKEHNAELGLQWYDYGARWYDPAVGRWGQVDPLAEKYYSWSAYNYVLGNPVQLVDPDGRSVQTDFYNQKGKYLGTDGKNDGQIMVITNAKEARMIRKRNRKGGITELKDVQSGVMLPSAYVRKEMGKAVARAGSPSFHEEGGWFGRTSDGKEFVVHAKPGEKVDPTKKKFASINVFDPADPSSIPNDANATIEGTFHTHPNGKKPNTETNEIMSFRYEPSPTDIESAAVRKARGVVQGNHYVLAQGNKKVYIYNESGVIATFPLDKFIKIGNQ